MADQKIETKPDSAILSPDSVVVGIVVGCDEGAQTPRVSFPGCAVEAGVAARSIVALHSADIGKQVALLFEGGDLGKPMIIGKIQVPGIAARQSASFQPNVDASVDGERLEFRADREIVLKCGKASITLTRAGKIIIRGAYLLNRSSGVNKIKGASVQIN